MKHLLSTIFLSLSLACSVDDGYHPPPPVESATLGTDSAGTDAVDPDTTAGEQCEEFSHYRCRGFVADVYRHMTIGLKFSDIPYGAAGFDPLDAYACIGNGPGDDTDMIVTAPRGTPPDDPIIFNACTEACIEENVDYGWPDPFGTSGQWVFDHRECVFGPLANGGESFDPSVAGVADCAAVGAAQQNEEIDEDATPDECAPVDCSDWDPNASIAYAVRGTTHEATFDAGFAAYLQTPEGYNKLYGCDDGRYMQSHTGAPPVESWKMVGLSSGEVLYRMGFRSNDKDLKIKRANCSICGYYPLTTLAGMRTAYAAIGSYDDFVVQWKRGTTTHTLNLAL